MTQEQQRQETARREYDEITDLPTSDVQERKAKLDESTEDLLADIDKILEPNAQDFVNSFVQKGGQ